MEPFTKLYKRVTHSSVWKLPSDIRIVWITLLANKDEHGQVLGSKQWLADEAVVSLESCEEALRAFLSPDPHSRTEANEGRRIAEIPGGWVVLNHYLYRDGMDFMREKWRRQKAQQRERERKEKGPSAVYRSRERRYEKAMERGDENVAMGIVEEGLPKSEA